MFELLGSTATSFVPRMFVARSSVHVEPVCRYTPRTAHPCGVGQPTAPPVTELTPRMALASPMSRLPAPSKAMLETARSVKRSEPGTSVQVAPPSVVL
jgi:hypothetical protein